ncbi:MAG: tRNA (adenosine(37)-N6)-threonylcarbamoyltransferase complex dimerization subunit type 1 TsaB [Patescibacteria group bacterium]
MKLIIDSTDSKNITVKIEDKKSGTSDSLFEEQKTGSQVLLPMIDTLLKKNKITLAQIKEIEVNSGPGSFTGTRVGVSIANALGFALNIPVNGKKGKIVVPVYEKSKFD